VTQRVVSPGSFVCGSQDMGWFHTTLLHYMLAFYVDRCFSDFPRIGRISKFSFYICLGIHVLGFSSFIM
jgi:hypothetical protein